jgi:hypothetical protein
MPSLAASYDLGIRSGYLQSAPLLLVRSRESPASLDFLDELSYHMKHFCSLDVFRLIIELYVAWRTYGT